MELLIFELEKLEKREKGAREGEDEISFIRHKTMQGASVAPYGLRLPLSESNKKAESEQVRKPLFLMLFFQCFMTAVPMPRFSSILS